MATYVARHTAAAWIWNLGQAMSAGAAGLRRNARRLDAWFAARGQAAADQEALFAMGARELRDIGLDPVHVRGVAHDAWTRDWAM
jgi:hypothetical protein